MEDTYKRLDEVVRKFLVNELSADTFEMKFTEIYDFEDLPENGELNNYFSSIRTLLERYTFSENDLKLDPGYYINSNQLKQAINSMNKK